MSTLAYETVIGEKNSTTWLCFIHGFLGSRTNLRSIARGLVKKRPECAIILPDVPNHGASQNCEPPFTLARSAEFIRDLIIEQQLPVSVVVGHSMGAKIAMAMLQIMPQLGSCIFIDNVVWARSSHSKISMPQRVLAMLEPLASRVFSSRKQFVALVMSHGYSEAMALWLAMNLDRYSDEDYRLRLTISALSEMLEDHNATDVEHIVRRYRDEKNITFVLGASSQALSDDDRARMALLAPTHIVAHAGHDVHIDQPEQVIELIIHSCGL